MTVGQPSGSNDIKVVKLHYFSSSRFRSTPTQSIVEYVPRTELDYGSLLCWASNSIGRQRDPCIFHLIPAGTPDSVKNCSFGNQTTSSLQANFIILVFRNYKQLHTLVTFKDIKKTYIILY